VRLVYMDESVADFRHSLIGAVLVNDLEFGHTEGYMGFIIEQYVPEEIWEEFEFHASDVYHGNKPFENLGREKAIEILRQCCSMVRQMKTPIVYGAVDAHKLRGSLFATSTPLDVAFRLCIPEIERWFVENDPEQMGIIIADDPSNNHYKTQMQSAFRSFRKKIRVTTEKDSEGKLLKAREEKGTLDHIHDDMYFGNSNFSKGLQVADVCSWVIQRHLEGKKDTEFLYKEIEGQIFFGKVVP